MFVLTMSPPLLTALGIVREKERGSIYNIYSSTVTRFEFLMGKLLPSAIISSINVVVLWLMAVYVFGAPFKGSFAFFFAASLLFIVCTTGIGLVISMLVRTQQAALIITILISIIPSVNYSGLLVPVTSLTHGAQAFAHAFPAMYYTNIVRGIFLKGVGVDVLWPDVLILVAFAVALRVVGWLLFTKRPRA
jgi:ABC-2 type transport system permease protein/ribosome-dependent ATPase